MKKVNNFRQFHNEELLDLYRSSNVVSIVKLSRLRWAGHVARMGRRGMHTEFWYEILLENTHLKNRE
jgi:hypothetical protein